MFTTVYLILSLEHPGSQNGLTSERSERILRSHLFSDSVLIGSIKGFHFIENHHADG